MIILIRALNGFAKYAFLEFVKTAPKRRRIVLTQANSGHDYLPERFCDGRLGAQPARFKDTPAARNKFGDRCEL